MPRLPQQATAAILGTLLAVALPAGIALGASPNARHGVEVSALAQTNIAGVAGHGVVVSTLAKTKPAPPVGASTVPTVPAAAPAAHPENHGGDVSAVAKDQSAAGGTHDNHGGAVVPVAHKH